MNCVNASLNGELIQFDCPNCGVDVEINGETHDELWENFDGMVTCPLPDGCNSFIKVPSHEELDQLKNPTDENTEPEKWSLKSIHQTSQTNHFGTFPNLETLPSWTGA